MRICRNRWWAVVAATAALFLMPLTVSWPLLDPDEGLHAAIAQEMVERGDWLVPRLFGRAFWDKPAFYFWFEAASLNLLGMNERAVRLPGLLFAIFGVISTGWMASRAFGPAVAPWAGAFYATTFLPMALSLAATHDVALVVWTNIALVALWEFGWSRSRIGQAGWVIVAGAALGLAMLTKGLFGPALVLVAHASYLIFARKLRWAEVINGSVALAIGSAIAASWFVPMHQSNPGYVHYFFVERHFLGLFGATQTHGGQPAWYYLPVLLLGGMPWIAYLPPLVRDALDRRAAMRPSVAGDHCTNASPQSCSRTDRSEARDHASPTHRSPEAASDDDHRRAAVVWLWCQLIGCTLLLSTAGSKLATYLWPVFPAVAVLAAYAWQQRFDGRLSPWAGRMIDRSFTVSCLAGPLVFPPAAIVAAAKLDLIVPALAWCAVASASLIPMLVILVRRWFGPARALAAAVATTALQFLLAVAFVLPPVAEQLSARHLADAFNLRPTMPERVRVVDERVGSLVFYLKPEHRRTLRPGTIARISARLLPYEQVPMTAVVPETRLVRVRRHCDIHRVPFEIVGRHRIYDIEVSIAP